MNPPTLLASDLQNALNAYTNTQKADKLRFAESLKMCADIRSTEEQQKKQRDLALTAKLCDIAQKTTTIHLSPAQKRVLEAKVLIDAKKDDSDATPISSSGFRVVNSGGNTTILFVGPVSHEHDTYKLDFNSVARREKLIIHKADVSAEFHKLAPEIDPSFESKAFVSAICKDPTYTSAIKNKLLTEEITANEKIKSAFLTKIDRHIASVGPDAPLTKLKLSGITTLFE